MSIRDFLLRRDLLKLSAAGLLTSLGTPWFKVLAADAAQQKRKVAKNCILLWMDGGPSQAHTFDPKSKCQYKTISTAVPGIEVTEYLPKLAAEMKELALLRSMTSREGDHYRAKYLLHTGYPRVGGFEHPALGCMVSSQIGNPTNEMPNFVTIDAGFDKGNGGRLYRNVPSYAGVQHAPLAVSDPSKGLENLHGQEDAAFASQLDTLLRSESRLLANGGATVTARHDALQRALTLMKSPKSRAFNLDDEPAKLREAYGDHAFGKACLMARRLVESGTRFVEIFHRGWDDHEGAAKRVHLRCPWMDAGMATLIADLRDRGMLDDTLIVWMGEFGRSPVDGSGHHAAAWTTVLAGGGLKTGQTIGKTDDKEKNPGGTVAERPITVPDFFATICHALGIDPTHELLAPGERPMRLVEKTGVPLSELF
jgi:uncharacterized protein (DUF1501 family)